MRLETVTLFMSLLVVTSGQKAYGRDREYGRINARLQTRLQNKGVRDHSAAAKDTNRFDGNAQLRAQWAGQSAVKDKQLARNEQDLQNRVNSAKQNFGKFSNNFGDITKRIRDESARHGYVIKDDAQYQRNNLNGAQGASQANAKKTAFNKGDVLNDNIKYIFNKKFDKSSNENGGYEEENGRNFKKLNLIDEREQDQKLIRGDSVVNRSQFDQQRAVKDQEWKSKAAQKQGQEGKYGFADRQTDKVGERSDNRAIDYDRKDSRYQEQEQGRDEAVRLAQDLALQQAGYNNQAQAIADASRGVVDAKYYGGKHNVAGTNGGYGPGAVAVSGDKARHEASGGAIRSGFDENTAQHETGNELASAKADSSATAANDYQRNKERLAYDQVRGLQDRSQGQFKQGLQDAASLGFSDNNAQAAKASAESDKSSGDSRFTSNLEAKEKDENEALRNRNYVRQIQNADSETFSRTKQFFHNKKEKGQNDENLDYDRTKNGRNYGITDLANLAKQNQSQNLHQEGKVASQAEYFEDVLDRQNKLRHDNTVKQDAEKGFTNRDAQDTQQALSADNGFVRELDKSAEDDSQSQAHNIRQSLQDESDSERRAATDSKEQTKNVVADIEYSRPTNGQPLDDVRAGDFIDSSLLHGQVENKEHTLPDVVVDIKPIEPPSKVEPPKRVKPIAELPDVQQVKAYQPPNYNKAEVSYDTGRSANQGNFNRPSFRRFGSLSLFQGPRKGTLNPEKQASPKRSFSLQRFQPQNAATSSFGRGMFGGTNQFNRFVRGSYGR